MEQPAVRLTDAELRHELDYEGSEHDITIIHAMARELLEAREILRQQIEAAPAVSERTFSSLFRPPGPDISALGDAAMAKFSRARMEMDRRIDSDVALLRAAGVPIGRISMQVALETGEQSLLVGDAVVRRYRLELTVDGKPIEVLR